MFASDGPALRSTAIINYANWLIANGNTTYVTSTLWPIIKLDLDYVASNWNQTTYALEPQVLRNPRSRIYFFLLL